jgi:hypothetical protein
MVVGIRCKQASKNYTHLLECLFILEKSQNDILFESWKKLKQCYNVLLCKYVIQEPSLNMSFVKNL